MTEAQLYEKVGRLQMAHEEQNTEYDRLLSVLAQLVSGEVAPSRLLVNLTDRRWEMAPPGERPATPGTINGLPRCVTAPLPPTSGPAPSDLIIPGRMTTLEALREALQTQNGDQ